MYIFNEWINRIKIKIKRKYLFSHTNAPEIVSNYYYAFVLVNEHDVTSDKLHVFYLSVVTRFSLSVDIVFSVFLLDFANDSV